MMLHKHTGYHLQSLAATKLFSNVWAAYSGAGAAAESRHMHSFLAGSGQAAAADVSLIASHASPTSDILGSLLCDW